MLQAIPLPALELVFEHSGAIGTARVACTCTELAASSSWRSIWRLFAANDFGMHDIGTASSDWLAAYRFCARSLGPHERIALRMARHNDDEGEYRIPYPPSSALALGNDNRICWCTSGGHSKNVDLVASAVVGGYFMVTGFSVSNPGIGFDCPVRDALLFGMCSDPDSGSESTSSGSRVDDAVGRTFAYRVGSALDCPQDRRAELVRTLAAQPVVTIRDRAAAGALPACTVPTGVRQPDAPIGAIAFPPYPECRELSLMQRVVPTVCTHVLFRLLRSYNPSQHEFPNIDVKRLHVHGVALPGLEQLLGSRPTGQLN